MISGLALFIALFVFPEEFIRGINSGLMNSIEIIIPSVFPFLIASSLAGSGNLSTGIKKFFDPITRFLFRLPAECLPALVLGQLGGYLSGAKTVQSLYSNGNLTKSQSTRLINFCINAGIGFSVNAIGNAMLCSREAGKVVFVSLCISSLITGVFGRFIPDEGTTACAKNKNIPDFSAAVVSGVSSSAQAMLVVCSFTALFSGICAASAELIKSENLRLVISCLLEVTTGCAGISGKVSLPTITAVCAFGGICVHLQIFSLTGELGLKKLPFYAFRFFHAAASYAVCRIILYFHPADIPVFLSFSENAAVFSFSAPAAISLLFLCFLLILDLDNETKIC